MSITDASKFVDGLVNKQKDFNRRWVTEKSGYNTQNKYIVERDFFHPIVAV